MVSSAASRLRSHVAAFLPVLCLIHCIATALFAAVLPAFALWLQSEWIEAALTLISLLLIGGPLVRRSPDHDREGLSLALFAAGVALIGLGWLYGQEPPRHLGLLMLVATQLVFWRSRRTQRACDCTSSPDDVRRAAEC